MTATDPEISLIIPALNEADNLPVLCERIDAALRGRRYEILLVDDNSKDATPQVCEELSKKYPLRLIVRTTPKDGLSGAVLHGMAQANGALLVVMDADLQHPPERLPDLLAPLERGEADFTLGSRYVPGGSTGEQWGLFRKINSQVATLLARPFAGKTNDPMSGFFALRRDRYRQAERLTPLGYKIALELMCKCRVQNVREVPIHFAERQCGKSKLNLKEQFRYLEHLSRLYDFTFPRLSPVSKFAIVLGLGWFVGVGGALLLIAGGVSRAVAIVASYVLVIAITAVFHRRYIRTQREFIVGNHPWLEFAAIATGELLSCAFATIWATSRAPQISLLEMLVLAFGAATITRYVLRKELMHDIRGLRRELRHDELA